MDTGYRTYINGDFTDSMTSDSIEVANPATEEVLASVPDCSANGVDRAVRAAKAAQPA